MSWKDAFPEELQRNSTKQFFILHFRDSKSTFGGQTHPDNPIPNPRLEYIYHHLKFIYTVKVKFWGSFSKITSLKLGCKKMRNTPLSVNNQECVHVRTTHWAGPCLLPSKMRHHIFCSWGPLNTKTLVLLQEQVLVASPRWLERIGKGPHFWVLRGRVGPLDTHLCPHVSVSSPFPFLPPSSLRL